MAERRSESGIPLQPSYTSADLPPEEPPPGDFPYTRGVYADMYRGRHWTMRQYAGFATAAESNQRYRKLLEAGQTGLSVAFDLVTQMGYDSDDAVAEGEVGKVGVAIDSLADMEVLLGGIPLDRVSTSMTINAPAAGLMLLYQLTAEKQGVPSDRLTGTIQNDILKEYAARGTYIFPPGPSMRLITDTFAYCAEEMPRWNTISISGYHISEAGATPMQELAFTLADGIAYVDAAIAAGLKIDDFAPRLSFFFNCKMDFFEEIAKFRAARKMWATLMRDRYGARDPRSMMLRFHTQTAGSSLTSLQPHNNVVRTTVEALAAVLGGTQSLHTNGFDEALALPTEFAATLALRTQQVIAYETGVTASADPLAGSYLLERLTAEIEAGAWKLIGEIDEMGGAVEAIESGWMKRQIADSAYRFQQAIESGERVVVGVNKFTAGTEEDVEIQRVLPLHEQAQREAVARVRAERDAAAVARDLDALEAAARGPDNVLHPMKQALRDYATLGEVFGRLRRVWGVYRPAAEI
ncbi:MAG TPA: methylmalonyl-CoA mutase family protein [Candidatus Dormibacteraeota bacterium]|nr:methylmalonyl-CoA mutase family protein [Candidatus Dormibacteraeota bacterium]